MKAKTCTHSSTGVSSWFRVQGLGFRGVCRIVSESTILAYKDNSAVSSLGLTLETYQISMGTAQRQRPCTKPDSEPH